MSIITFDSLPPFQPYNISVRDRQISFYEWIDSPIKDINGEVEENKNQAVHSDYIKYFNSRIEDFLKTNMLQINNKKEFKNELATFVYRTSDE